MVETKFTAEGKSRADTWQEALELLKKGNNDFATGSTTHPERGRETLFRATYQNQSSLIQMADNKANIIISINTMIISSIIAITERHFTRFDLRAADEID